MGPPGHFGIAFAAKPLAPAGPLWALLLASEALDILSFGFISLGMESMAVSEISLQHGLQTIVPGFIISIILEFILLTSGLVVYWLARKKKAFHKSFPPAV